MSPILNELAAEYVIPSRVTGFQLFYVLNIYLLRLLCCARNDATTLIICDVPICARTIFNHIAITTSTLNELTAEHVIAICVAKQSRKHSQFSLKYQYQ